MTDKPSLKLDWCSHEAAEFATKHWHYSGCMPASKVLKIGVWENSRFIGCILYSWGNSPQIGCPYNLKMTEICELTRVALKQHKSPVSRIVAVSLKMLKQNSPGLRLVVSFADAQQGHHGGIYQAGNWTYVGAMPSQSVIVINGRARHNRSVGSIYGTANIEWIRAHIDKDAHRVRTAPKHKYLMPLDEEMRRRIAALAKPYPKRCVGSIDVDAPGRQPGQGGSSPTPTLHIPAT